MGVGFHFSCYHHIIRTNVMLHHVTRLNLEIIQSHKTRELHGKLNWSIQLSTRLSSSNKTKARQIVYQFKAQNKENSNLPKRKIFFLRHNTAFVMTHHKYQTHKIIFIKDSIYGSHASWVPLLLLPPYNKDKYLTHTYSTCRVPQPSRSRGAVFSCLGTCPLTP